MISLRKYLKLTIAGSILVYCYIRSTNTSDEEPRVRNVIQRQDGCWRMNLDLRWTGNIRNLINTQPHPCEHTGLKRRLPSAILIGERKTGTSTIMRFLRFTNTRIKASDHGEIHFFDKKSSYNKGPDYYRSLMPVSCPGDVTMEKTPSYFRNAHAYLRIHGLLPRVRLLVSLRDPVARAISDFHLEVSRAEEGFDDETWYAQGNFEDFAFNRHTRTLNESFPPIRISLYDLNLKRWLKYFPRDQFHFIDSDMITRDPVPELRKIEEFLGLKPCITSDMITFNHTKGFFCLTGTPCAGMKSGHKYEPIPAYVVEKLTDYYRPHVLTLYNMIGRKLSWMDKYLDRS